MHAPIYPNVFVVLVAGPAIGKSIPIRSASRLISSVGTFVGVEDVSKASLKDELADALRKASDGTPYHSMTLAVPELGNFIPALDTSLMNTLNELYDCADVIGERKRGNDRKTKLHNVQMSLLGGLQPEFLAAVLPAAAWAYGFPSRCLFIHSTERIRPDIFIDHPSDEALQSDLLHDLTQISRLEGEFTLSSEARRALESWYDDELAPIPTHAKLRHYIGRRFVHFMKLLMIVTVAKGNSLCAEVQHFAEAKDLLINTEARIPSIFQEVSSSEENAIMEDLRHFVHAAEAKGPVTRSMLQSFLLGRMNSYRLDDFIRLACEIGYIKVNRGLTGTTFRALF